jgi:putative glycosyltransferase (TIGR04372 family)
VSEIRKAIRRLGVFVRRNVDDLRQKGVFGALKTKMPSARLHISSVGIKIVGIPFALVFVVVSRLLRPWVRMRLGTMNTTRLGHLLIDVEMAVTETEVLLADTRVVDIWFPWSAGRPVVNRTLFAMWKRELRVWPAWLCSAAYSLNGYLPDGKHFRIPYRKGSKVLSNFNDIHGVFRTTSPHLRFSDDEVAEASRLLRSRGITDHDRIVCVHVRTGAFLAAQMGAANSVTHDFRNSSIRHFEETMVSLAKQGFKVVRLGSVSEEPVSVQHPNLVDYANDGLRSELLDLFLPSRCHLFVAVLSGPTHVAQLFRKPIVLTNVVPLSRMMLSMENFWFIPKKLFLRSEDRFLSLREIVELEIEDLDSSTGFEDRGIELVDNTSTEISAVTAEALGVLDGTFRYGPDDESLQQHFLNLLPDYLKIGGGYGRIGNRFLYDNPWFLN